MLGTPSHLDTCTRRTLYVPGSPAGTSAGVRRARVPTNRSNRVNMGPYRSIMGPYRSIMAIYRSIMGLYGPNRALWPYIWYLAVYGHLAMLPGTRPRTGTLTAYWHPDCVLQHRRRAGQVPVMGDTSAVPEYGLVRAGSASFIQNCVFRTAESTGGVSVSVRSLKVVILGSRCQGGTLLLHQRYPIVRYPVSFRHVYTSHPVCTR